MTGPAFSLIWLVAMAPKRLACPVLEILRMGLIADAR